MIWWPEARRFTLELIGIVAVGIGIWYPAYAAHTATNRNTISAELWSLTVLRSDFGMILLMAVMIVVGIGAVSVLASLLEEGAPGVIVAGVSIGSMIALLVLAWRFDSALMLVLLISLLAVTAAWHWLEDSAMLWSAGLILFACVLLAAAQTQSFQPDPGGASNSLQLLPLVWMTVVLAIGIAFARAMSSLKSDAKLPAGLAALIVTIALLVPTFDHLRAGYHERTSLASPVIIAPDGELAAAEWLQQNTTGTPVILTNDGPGAGLTGTISAIAGFPSVMGSNPVELNTRPGWDRMVEHRTTDVTTIYTGVHDWSLVSPLIEQYGIRYIVVGDEERARYGVLDDSFVTAEANGHLHLVFEYDDVAIYQVVTDP